MEPVKHPRRSARRAHDTREKPEVPRAVARRKRLRRIGNALAMTVLAALVVLLVIICPKEPVRHAYYTVGTEDNVVTVTGNAGSAYQGLVISEVMTSNQTAMPDENGEFPDWVEIWNSSANVINMHNVGLSDDELSIAFLFPDITLAPDERIIVLCDKTNQAVPGKPLHAKFGLTTNGETVVLYDPNAYVIDSVKTPIMSADESYARTADGKWVLTSDYSPGYENTADGYLAYRTATMVTDGAVIINEICPDPMTGYADAEGDFCDWVELYNTTGQTVSLANYALSNREDKPLRWRFPEDAYIAPYGYYIVYCSGKENVTERSGIPHASFKISAEHDTIVLSDNRGRLLDRVTLDNVPEDASYARQEDGTFVIRDRSTPALPNTESGENRMDAYLVALNETGVYITEVMCSNDSVETVSGAAFTDWIEIYNASQVTVDISGYGLSNSLGRARKWQFPEGTVISPGEYRIIWCDGAAASSTAAEAHTSFTLAKNGLKSDGGKEVLVFADPTGRILDKIVLPAVPTNVSYGRTMGREGLFYYDVPTPGAQNGAGFLGYAEMPQLTVEPGMHDQGVQVGFTIPEGTTVFYTTDGSIPTQYTGNAYYGQILEINRNTVLRARAFPADPQLQPSTVVTGTYFINTHHVLPVVSVVMDPYELWNPDTGMLTIGENIIKPGPGKLPWKNTVYREFGKEPREGYIEYYDLDGTQLISQGAAIGLIGDFSLDMPQKSMKVRAKSLYGEKTFQTAFFEDRPFTEYKSIVLRNSGNDCAWTRLLDGFQSRLVDSYQAVKLEADADGSYAKSQVIHQAWKPVAVYLNGMYWGHYNLRERVDRFFVAQHEGIGLDQAENMDILVGNGTVEFGSNKEYKAMLKKIKAGDPARNPEDLQYILDNVDVDNYMEYIALEMFFGNSDIGNIRYYRLHGTDPETGEPYKWKWIMYDVDYGLFRSGFDSAKSYTKAKGMGDKNIDNTILLKLLSVPEYKDKFLRKLGDIYQTFTTEYMSGILAQCVSEIEPEMEMHFSRWAEEHDQMVIAEWPITPDGAYRYWEQRINRLYNTLKLRPNYLWGFVKNAFSLTDAQTESYLGPQPPIPEDAVL